MVMDSCPDNDKALVMGEVLPPQASPSPSSHRNEAISKLRLVSPPSTRRRFTQAPPMSVSNAAVNLASL